MPSNKKSDYEVGYKKPPVHSRWKKGQSGNLKGRKKGKVRVADLDEVIDEVLAALVAVNENGRPLKISKHRAFVTQIVNKAIKGDSKAAGLLMSHLARRAVQKDSGRSIDEIPQEQGQREFNALFDQMAENLRKRPDAKKADNDDGSSEPGGSPASPPGPR
jgi:hypothetical protein